MKNKIEFSQVLEEQIENTLSLGWCGDLDPFISFVTVALNKHLYDVLNEKSSHKVTFDNWENLLINKDNLIELLQELREYQENGYLSSLFLKTK